MEENCFFQMNLLSVWRKNIYEQSYLLKDYGNQKTRKMHSVTLMFAAQVTPFLSRFWPCRTPTESCGNVV